MKRNNTTAAARQRYEETKAAFKEGWLKQETIGGGYPPGKDGAELAWRECQARQLLARPLHPNFDCLCGSTEWRLAIHSKDFICAECFAPAITLHDIIARAKEKPPPKSRTDNFKQVGDAIKRP